MPFGGSRLGLNLLRSIPELFWALIFILAVGPWPFAGARALGFHTGGVLGKLFSEVIEEVKPQPIEAL
jgi:phosphonate transport system permease protein